jgi:hypothetical protein
MGSVACEKCGKVIDESEAKHGDCDQCSLCAGCVADYIAKDCKECKVRG